MRQTNEAKWKWVTLQFCKNGIFCEACMILRTAIVTTMAGEMERTRLPSHSNRNVFRFEEGEGRSGYEVFDRGVSRWRERSGASFLDAGQAKKSARGMPWHQEPTKDVTSCDKPRGAAHKPRSVDFRMGKPGTAIPCHRALNQIGVRREPPELKHLSRARKRHQPRFRE